MNKLLLWDIYEINSNTSSLNGVMLRGRIRRLGIEKGFNVLVENTEDVQNGVRFAVLDDSSKKLIIEYLMSITTDIAIQLVQEKCPNPVLSKLKVNIESRYEL